MPIAVISSLALSNGSEPGLRCYAAAVLTRCSCHMDLSEHHHTALLMSLAADATACSQHLRSRRARM